MSEVQNGDCGQFDDVIRTFHADIANVGAHMYFDAQARLLYSREIRKMAVRIATQVQNGSISWAQAAHEAQQIRNIVIEQVRSKSTAVGRAQAQALKPKGRTLNQMIAKKTQKLFGKKQSFPKLSSSQKNQVYAEVVKSAGKSSPRVNIVMRRISKAGRGLLVLSVAVSVYNISTAENKRYVAGRELTVTGAGIGGGMASGALAGLACGPGAPVCVAVGAFVGGAFAAYGVSLLW